MSFKVRPMDTEVRLLLKDLLAVSIGGTMKRWLSGN
jgi:hypothetical protein